MFKRWLIALSLLMLFGLAACDQGLSEDDAERTLRNAFSGEIEAANAHFCDKAQLHEAIALPDNVVFKEVTCDKEGLGTMACTASVELAGSERKVNMQFTLTDDKLCDMVIE